MPGLPRCHRPATALAAAAGVLVIGSTMAVVHHAHAGTAAANVCPAGHVCVDTGKDETGRQFDTGPATPGCLDVEQGATVDSADNESSVPVDFGNGTCSSSGGKGDPKDVVQPKTKENLPDPVDLMRTR